MDGKVMNDKKSGAHILAFPYPSQGHINPIFQLCKRLASKGVKITLALTNFIFKSTHPTSGTVGIDTVSDGYDEGGFGEASSVEAYLKRFEEAGSKTLASLVEKYENSEFPITCIIYDAFMPWALDVAKAHGLIGACFFTQACALNFIYYNAYHGKLTFPVKIPGLPELQLEDMPSFISHGIYPAYFELVLNQFVNLEKADYVFVNSFYKLEAEVEDAMSKVFPMMWTIGPTLPSFYLDNRVENDSEYGLNLIKSDGDSSKSCISWLNTKPQGSVVYVAFGSMATIDANQMEEIAWGLKATNAYFLWVVRASDEAKIPTDLTCEKGLVIEWSPQLKVLSNKAIGCFFTHGGWNSTIEALSLGVAMVVMPLWTDQTTNAKLVEDVWGVGVRVKEKLGVVGREEVEGCVRTVLEGVKGKEMKKNALKWKDLAKEAIGEGGSSDKNILNFVSKLCASTG